MKGKRNEAFFQQQNPPGVGFGGNRASGRGSGSGQTLSYSTLYKNARKSGILNLSSKSLRTPPMEIFCLDTKLESDENFWEICPLTKLDLSHNEITELPLEVSNLIDLMTLKLRGNRLENLPPTLGSCIRLRHLDLSSNSLSFIDHIEGILSDLQECFLSENSLVQLPSFLFYSHELKLLEANSNRLSSLSPDIGNLRQLTRLCLNNNALQELPSALSSLHKLQVLDVRKNRLTDIPDLSSLASLQLLDLGENCLTRVPPLPRNCQLGRLHLDWNQLRVIDPDAISVASPTLFELHLHDNKITILPPELALCSSLKVLDISNNDVNDIPASIGYMDTLQRSPFPLVALRMISASPSHRFLLDGNPIRAIRRSLLTQSTHDLKKYLRTRGPPLAGSQSKDEEVQSTGQGKTQQELIRRMRDIE
jgi:Leucine-rich repeat (LRR) protein